MSRSTTLDKRRTQNSTSLRSACSWLNQLVNSLRFTGAAMGLLALALLFSACAPVAPSLFATTLHPPSGRSGVGAPPTAPQVAPLRAPFSVALAPAVSCPLVQRRQLASQQSATLHGDNESGQPSEFAATRPQSASLSSKFGIDPLHPIHISNGALTPTAANPLLVAETGAGWVRLNFILGPWRSPVDRTRHHGCTWQETYRSIIDGYKTAGVGIYGLISYEAMPTDPGDALRVAPPPRIDSHPWVDDYIANFMRILRIFGRDVTIVETLNEPDDWHGGRSHWVHPAWYAVIQQRIHHAVKDDPALRHITLVSGPLQGMTNNNNGAPGYLRQVYRHGKERFGWGTNGVAFPFDGIGLHLYLRDRYYVDSIQQSRVIEQLYWRYVGEVQRVIEQEEADLRPIYLSEIGWASRPDDESLQAANLRTAFRLIAEDPQIALAIWFAIQDFSVPGDVMRYGLYRQGNLTPDNRKPAFDAFREAVSSSP